MNNQEIISIKMPDKRVKHGMIKTRTYRIWVEMRRRCRDPKRKDYPRYGAAGVLVCPTWDVSFEAFLSDMGSAPDGCSIDRRDGSKGYDPSNCQWATPKEQLRNIKTNVWMEHDGHRLCLTDWSAKTGIDLSTLWRRLKRGWTVERTLTVPVEKRFCRFKNAQK